MERINIAKLLKDCPTGMELDCIMFDNVTLKDVDFNSKYPIKITHQADEDTYTYALTEYGCWRHTSDSKCLIFPKGKTTWEEFTPPCKFKDGDIISDSLGTCIFKGEGTIKGTVDYYCGISGVYFSVKNHKQYPNVHFGNIVNYRFAFEEEKEKLFKAIKANGYRWNPKNKTLKELPKFKIGDKIRHKTNNKHYIYEINKVYDDSYGLVGITYNLPIECQKYYELVLDKFDINTLIPFESRVLVRSCANNSWRPAIFGFYKKEDSAPYFVLGGTYWPCCIPYEGNEHLLGATDECDEFYKIWK